MTGAQLFGTGVAAAVLRAEVGWLLTYGLHAVIAAVVAEVLVRVANPSPADEHRLWKMALALPLATACVAALFGGAAFGRTLAPAWRALVAIQVSQSMAAAFAPATVFDTRLVLAALLAANVGVVVGAARFTVAFTRLRRRLGDRQTSVDPRLRSALARMSPQFALGRIELTESVRVTSPTAVRARAVCFPLGSTASLADDEIDAVLAHELAHLERRDPAWFFFAGLVQGALWMQPFNHRVAARLRRSAELACDQRAVATTGNPLGLARGLSVFAHAALGAPASAVAQPSFGGARPHAVVERVRRLATAAPAALPSRGAARRSLATGAAFVLVAIASANLNVTFARPVRDGASDVAAAGQRAAYLTSEEARLQTEMEAAGVVSGGAVTRAAPSHLLELEQDLRHVREERAWLERTVSQTVEP